MVLDTTVGGETDMYLTVWRPLYRMVGVCVYCGTGTDIAVPRRSSQLVHLIKAVCPLSQSRVKCLLSFRRRRCRPDGGGFATQRSCRVSVAKGVAHREKYGPISCQIGHQG